VLHKEAGDLLADDRAQDVSRPEVDAAPTRAPRISLSASEKREKLRVVWESVLNALKARMTLHAVDGYERAGFATLEASLHVQSPRGGEVRRPGSSPA
jgi:hypothetical protein